MAKNIATGLGAVCVGLVNGLLGAGGGALVVVLLSRSLKLEQHRAQATAVAVMLPVSAVSAVVYGARGSVDWGLLWPLSLGTVSGALLGAGALYRFSSVWLRRGLGALMLLSAVRMLWSLR